MASLFGIIGAALLAAVAGTAIGIATHRPHRPRLMPRQIGPRRPRVATLYRSGNAGRRR